MSATVERGVSASTAVTAVSNALRSCDLGDAPSPDPATDPTRPAPPWPWPGPASRQQRRLPPGSQRDSDGHRDAVCADAWLTQQSRTSTATASGDWTDLPLGGNVTFAGMADGPVRLQTRAADPCHSYADVAPRTDDLAVDTTPPAITISGPAADVYDSDDPGVVGLRRRRLRGQVDGGDARRADSGAGHGRRVPTGSGRAHRRCHRYRSAQQLPGDEDLPGPRHRPEPPREPDRRGAERASCGRASTPASDPSSRPLSPVTRGAALHRARTTTGLPVRARGSVGSGHRPCHGEAPQDLRSGPHRIQRITAANIQLVPTRTGPPIQGTDLPEQ